MQSYEIEMNTFRNSTLHWELFDCGAIVRVGASYSQMLMPSRQG